MDPAYLSIGLQFDVSNYYVYNKSGELISEFDLMETYQDVKKFEELLHYYGLKNFRIIEPLASATSFAIYEILRKKYGVTELKKMNSCWTPLKNGTPCGKCLKCQRVSYIYSCLGMELSEQEKESLKLFHESGYPLDYLFGSITCMQLLNTYNPKELKGVLFVDEKVRDLDKGIHKKLSKQYHLRIEENPLKQEKGLRK